MTPTTHGWMRAAGVLALSALTAWGCAGITTGAYTATGANLAGYATYAWADDGDTPTGDPRLDSNPFFFDRLRARVDEGLAARGFERVGEDAALVVHVHASVTQQIDTSLIDQQFCVEGDCRPFVYDAGTLVLDFVDPATSRLVWRGWAESTLGEIVNDQALLEERVDRSVAEVLAQLPARP